MRPFPVLALVSSALVGACNDRPTAPPLPEALIVVDTDLPAPVVASRLRVDLYTTEGRWFDSFDAARPSKDDWPTSFSVYSDDESRERLVWVRLRVFPDGRVNAYRGERFRDWNRPFDATPGDGTPRLVKQDVDATPLTEPQPLVTVDRMILVRLRPEKRGRVRVVLRGACVGTMTRFDAGPGVPTQGGVESCVDKEKQRAPVAESPLEDDMTTPKESVQGTWLSEPACPSPRSDSPYVCVPGGGTILGSSENTAENSSTIVSFDSIPVRVFGLKRFWIDREEMSVARFRALVDEGKATTASGVLFNDGPLVGTTPPGSCVLSHGNQGREGYALNCVTWLRARETCKALGGDLPSETQWEHVATMAGYASKVSYPWGDDPPSCARGVYGRQTEPVVGAVCGDLGMGQQPLSANAADVSALGILGLAGGLQEWTRDDFFSYTADCWRDAPLVDPACETPSMLGLVSARGASYASPMPRMSLRQGATPGYELDVMGVRCIYATDPEGR